MARSSLPKLPYDYAALEPWYSAEVLELHHGKHHARSSRAPMTRSDVQPAIRLIRAERLKAPWFPSCITPVATAQRPRPEAPRNVARQRRPTGAT